MISELTKVPPGWEKVKFGDIAQNITDRIDNPKESGLEDYVGLEHLDTDEIRIKRYGSPDEVEATKFLCKKGDIIFGKRRAYLRKLAVTSRDAVVSAHSMVLRPNEKRVLSEFLPWFMQSSQFWKTAFAISEGSLSPTIKWKTLSAQEFWIPSWNEQRKIAEILWNVESNVERLEQLIQITEKLKKSLLEELLTKGIGHRDFKRTELGEIPVDWKVERLVDACEIIMGQSPPSSSYNSNQDGLPFIQGKADFGEKYPIITTYTNAPAKIAKSGDLLFTVRAPVGAMNWCNKEMCVGRGVAAFRPKGNTDSLFLYYTLERMNYEFNRLSQGSTFAAISGKELKNFKVTKVSIDEQETIGKILNEIDERIFQCRTHLSDLTSLRKKLANSFLSGELLVPKEAVN